MPKNPSHLRCSVRGRQDPPLASGVFRDSMPAASHPLAPAAFKYPHTHLQEVQNSLRDRFVFWVVWPSLHCSHCSSLSDGCWGGGLGAQISGMGLLPNNVRDVRRATQPSIVIIIVVTITLIHICIHIYIYIHVIIMIIIIVNIMLVIYS